MISELSSVKKQIKYFILNMSSGIQRERMRKHEIDKYKDPRRVAIYSDIELSKPQKEEIDSYYKKYYGSRIPHTWHRHFTAFTGQFDKKYFPEMLYIPEFENYMNPEPWYSKAFSDKNIISLIAEAAGIKTPKVYLSVTAGMFRDQKYSQLKLEEAKKIVENVGKVFVKPTVDSGGGRGCMIADFHEGIDRISGNSAEELFIKMGKNFVIQECVVCHESIRKLYPGSVNTLRIITFRWKEDLYHTPVIMRLGRNGAVVDNAHAGGLFIAVDEDGSLHEKAFTEFKEVYTEHPDTSIPFLGYKIKTIDEIIIAAKKIHCVIPQLGIINWDFMLDENGIPVLIEANMSGGSIWLIEMAHGLGAFGDHTEDILMWLRKMKRVKLQDQATHFYGN